MEKLIGDEKAEVLTNGLLNVYSSGIERKFVLAHKEIISDRLSGEKYPGQKPTILDSREYVYPGGIQYSMYRRAATPGVVWTMNLRRIFPSNLRFSMREPGILDRLMTFSSDQILWDLIHGSGIAERANGDGFDLGMLVHMEEWVPSPLSDYPNQYLIRSFPIIVLPRSNISRTEINGFEKQHEKLWTRKYGRKATRKPLLNPDVFYEAVRIKEKVSQ